MSDQELSSVLAVGLRPEEVSQGIVGSTCADSGRAAIEMLRMFRFDLVLTSDQLPDMPVWHFVKRMRAAWPWQKWALVSSQLSECDEITARTLGVMQIIEGAIDWDAVGHLAGTIREQVDAGRRLPAPSSIKVLRPAATG